MLKFNNNYVSIEILSDCTIIKLTWYGLVPAEKYREALDIALDIATSLSISHWITDASKMLPISIESQDWVINDWFPRAVASGFYKQQDLIPPDDITTRCAARRMVYLGKNDGVQFTNTNYSNLQLHPEFASLRSRMN
jgi:hypothetical protein